MQRCPPACLWPRLSLASELWHTYRLSIALAALKGHLPWLEWDLFPHSVALPQLGGLGALLVSAFHQLFTSPLVGQQKS